MAADFRMGEMLHGLHGLALQLEGALHVTRGFSS